MKTTYDRLFKIAEKFAVAAEPEDGAQRAYNIAWQDAYREAMRGKSSEVDKTHAAIVANDAGNREKEKYLAQANKSNQTIAGPGSVRRSGEGAPSVDPDDKPFIYKDEARDILEAADSVIEVAKTKNNKVVGGWISQLKGSLEKILYPDSRENKGELISGKARLNLIKQQMVGFQKAVDPNFEKWSDPEKYEMSVGLLDQNTMYNIYNDLFYTVDEKLIKSMRGNSGGSGGRVAVPTVDETKELSKRYSEEEEDNYDEGDYKPSTGSSNVETPVVTKEPTVQKYLEDNNSKIPEVPASAKSNYSDPKTWKKVYEDRTHEYYNNINDPSVSVKILKASLNSYFAKIAKAISKI